MFIKVTEKPNGKIYIRIMESVRQGNKVIQKTIRSLGWCKNHKELEKIKKLADTMMVEMKNQQKPTLPGMAQMAYSKDSQWVLRKQTDIPIQRSKKTQNKIKEKKKTKTSFCLSNPTEKQRVHQGIKTVCGSVYEQLGFHKIIEGTRKDGQWNEILKLCVLSRVAQPDSKRKTVESLRQDYNECVALEKMYRMMDRLYPHINRVKDLVCQRTLSLFNQDVEVLFFDVTTLYFESFCEDEIRQFGFSKDMKFKETQVVLALVTNSEGHPLSYELFPGKTNEATTFITVMGELKQRFKVKRAFVVADRAMFNESNLTMMEENDIEYVVAVKLKSLPRVKKTEILDQDFKPCVVNEQLQWVRDFEHNNRRLIVSYSAKRARKNESDRKRLIDRLMKRVKNKQIPVKSLISNHGTKKYITVKKTKATINEEKIKQDSLWDGLHGVVTNVKNTNSEQLLSRYRQLWKIEEAFRVCKHSLKMRPIYHWKKNRIEAHVAICFLAYCLSYNMKYRLEQKGVRFSLEKIRDILKKDQYSIIEDENKNLYRMPSRENEQIRTIYQAFGLRRNSGFSALLQT